MSAEDVRSRTGRERQSGAGDAGSVAKVAGQRGACEAADDRRPHDGDAHPSGGVRVGQQALRHVLGQGVAVGQAHLPQHGLGLQTRQIGSLIFQT